MDNTVEPIAWVVISVTVAIHVALLFLTYVAIKKKPHWTDFASFDPESVSAVQVKLRIYAGDRAHVILYVFRWLVLLFCAAINLYIIIMYQSALSFYTNWSFSLLCLNYIFMVTTMTMRFAKLTEWKSYWWTALIASLLYEMSFANALLVDMVLWLLLYLPAPNPDLLKFDSFVTHAANLGFYLIELCLNEMPFRSLGFIWQLQFAFLYAYFSWVFFSITGLWRYFFLDFNDVIGVAWYIALLALHIGFYFVIYGLHRLKARLLRNSLRYAEWEVIKDEEDQHS